MEHENLFALMGLVCVAPHLSKFVSISLGITYFIMSFLFVAGIIK